MSPKRPPGDDNNALSDRPSKRRRSSSSESLEDTSQSDRILNIFVVQVKLSEETVSEIYRLIDAHEPTTANTDDLLQLHLCSDAAQADVIITGVHMPKRLERHVDPSIAQQKIVVTPDWLRHSVKYGHPVPFGPFAAIPDYVSEQHPDDEPKSILLKGPSPVLPSRPRSTVPIESVGVVKPTSEKIKNNWRHRYACARASPLICQNQGLVVALNILGRSRELEGQAVNALAYERAVAILKSYPYVITQETFQRDIIKLPGIGSKIHAKIKEYIKRGEIEESESIHKSERYQALSLFASIYGVGPSTARELYDTGLRTIDDLERYYDVPPEFDASQLEGLETQIMTPNGKPIPSKNSKGDAKIPSISMKAALALRRDFEVTIPRYEVEEMHRVVMAELEEIQTGCVSTIVGGYRRGKIQSNDVDIVISHPDILKGASVIKGLCARFTKRLYERGLVTHVMHLSGFHTHNPLRVKHWDSLEKALTVIRVPAQSNMAAGEKQQDRLYRRLDLIFAPPEAYWTAVIGWSGSRMFERDLRLWAKVEKGMKFDSSGLTRRYDSKLFIPRSEEDVFEILGLEWIDPTMRNANV